MIASDLRVTSSLKMEDCIVFIDGAYLSLVSKFLGRRKPTVEYTYDEAIKDGVLVPYDAQIIETKVMKLGIKGSELSPELKTILIKQDEDPITLKFPDLDLQNISQTEKQMS